MKHLRMIVAVAAAFFLAAGLHAQVKALGVVQSYGNGSIVIGMATSTGHWTVDSATQVVGSIAVADWVYVDVEVSGHVDILRFVERPVVRGGVVQEVRGNVLVVQSGSADETWNVTSATILIGVQRGQFEPGEAITARIYRNHNLAEVALASSGNTADTAQAKSYAGVVQSYGNGAIVIAMPNSTGHWTVDSATQIVGSIAVADMVVANVAPSGHVDVLRFEERPAVREGMVQEVRGNVLVVQSGNADETWNVTPATMLTGVQRGQIQPGEAITARIFRNHNLAEVVMNMAPTNTGSATITVMNATTYPIVHVAATSQPGVDLLKGIEIMPGKSADVLVGAGSFNLLASVALPSTVESVARGGVFGGGHHYLWTVKEKPQTASRGSYRYIDSYEYLKQQAYSNPPAATNGAMVTTLPGSKAMFIPQGIAVDSSGNVYVADVGNSLIRKITPDGVVTTLAGSGSKGYADGRGTAASFNFPTGVGVDSAGNIFVADSSNHRIRKITPDGVVTTLAGSGGVGHADGPGAAASFSSASGGVAVDSSGNVYVADSSNNLIRKISPGGVVTTLAGSGLRGQADGRGTAATFSSPWGLGVDSSGNVYVADRNNGKIRKITPDGMVTTLAGSGSKGRADGPGPAASFNDPVGLAVDSSGNVYVADRGNNLIRKISPGIVVTTLAGSGQGGYVDGPSNAASFYSPLGIAVDSSGSVYVADFSNNLTRKIRQ